MAELNPPNIDKASKDHVTGWGHKLECRGVKLPLS
jgi:hypothetical protein